MKKSIIFLLIFFCCHLWMWAVPANKKLVSVQQPDGSWIEIRLVGDEFYHGHEDKDGYTIIKGGDGFYRYATQTKNGTLTTNKGHLVGKVHPQKLGLQKHWKDQALLKNASNRRKTRDGFKRSTPPKGTVKNLVVLVEFNDLYGQKTSTDFDLLFNQEGYNADGACGSVKDYYKETSYNQLTINSTVTASWVRLDNGYAYYGGNDGNGQDLRPQEMVLHALTKLNESMFNFASFDSDGDGWIDSITIIHAGYGEEAGADPDTIWSHQWGLDEIFTTHDNVKIQMYHTEPELRDNSGSGIVRIGVICHETGHFFGLPDLYDTDGSSSGLGKWCVMAGGSWGFVGEGLRPSHFSAWCKSQLGWVIPRNATFMNVLCSPVENEKDIVKITDGFPENQYLLIENRQKTKFDEYLPASGLHIYRVDENKTTNEEEWSGPGNDITKHYKVSMIQADGLWNLENDVNQGDANDVFTSGSLSKDVVSNPNSGYYGTSGTNTTTSGVDILDIQPSGSYMKFKITGVSGDSLGSWKWFNPWPSPYVLRGAWGTANNNIYAVGENGTILHYDGNTWRPMPSGTEINLYGIWGTGPNDIFAVGGDYSLGTGIILHYDGTNWYPMINSGTDRFYSVWGTSGTNVYTVGDAGLYHYDGTNWTQIPSVSNGNGIWGTSDTDIFVVKSGGVIQHYDGTSWSTMSSGTTNILYGVWGTSSTNVFAVGASGTILHYNGTNWSIINPTSNDLYAVWGTASNNVYAAGRQFIYQYNGTSWFPVVDAPSDAYYYGLWGSSSSDVCAVGYGYYNSCDSGTSIIKRYDGSSWNNIFSNTRKWFESIATVGNQYFIGGREDDYRGKIMRYDGSTWTTWIFDDPDPALNAGPFWAIWGSGPNDVFASSIYSGSTHTKIWHYNGSSWANIYIDVGTIRSIWGIKTSGQLDVFFVGDGGIILRYDGSSLTSMSSGTTNDLQGVWGTSATNVFAVGYNGTILHYDGNNWTAMSSGATNHLFSIWGTSGTDIFVTGNESLHYDGTSWSTLVNGPKGYRKSIWGTSSSNVYVTHSTDGLFHYDGTSWGKVPGITGHTMIEGIDQNNFLLVARQTAGDSASYIAQYKGTPSLSIDDRAVAEGNSGSVDATFTVTLFPTSTITATVDYETLNIGTTTSEDYTPVSGTLVFAPGERSKQINVPILGDTKYEPTEKFQVKLFNPLNTTLQDPQGICTITNDDGSPSITINDVTLKEGDSNTKNATFTVSLSAASYKTITVNYATANGTAISGSDYVAGSGTVTFNPDDLTKTVDIVVNGDTAIENDETFYVNLSGASNATISDSQGVGKIVNDDPTDIYDPDDDIGSGGTVLNVTSTLQSHGPHLLNALDQYDFYKIDMTAGHRYELKASYTARGSSTPIDPEVRAGYSYGELFSDEDGTNRVAYDDNSNGNNQFKILYIPTVTQTYYLRVRTDTLGQNWDGYIQYLYTPHTITTPGTPSGSTNADVGDNLTYSTTSCTCSHGHTVEYSFDWGDSTSSTWATSTSASHIYNTANTFTIRAKARCATTTTVESAWSGNKTVNIYSHLVSTPDLINGPSNGVVDQNLSYTITACTCNQGHTVQYQVNWGDGATSSWSTSTSCTHTYTSANTYSVKIQARCSNKTSIVSAWSTDKSVTITDGDAWDPSDNNGTGASVLTPTGVEQSHGPHSLRSNDYYDWFKISMTAGNRYELKSTSITRSSPSTKKLANRGRAGDTYGELYSDSDGVTRVAYDDNSNGNYQFKIVYTPTVTQDYFLRVRTYTLGNSWDGDIYYLCTEHAVTKPNTPTGSSNADVGENVTYTTGNSTCALGHSVQYMFDWGDSTSSEWTSSSSASHTYTSAETYMVRARARCATETTILSEWSDTKSVTVTNHTITTPNTPDGPSSGKIGESLTYSTGNGKCNQGHNVEYQFDWGDGSSSPWASSNSASHEFGSSGAKTIKARARCATKPTTMSSDSSGKSVTISEGDSWDPGDDTGSGATVLSVTTTEQGHGPHSLGASDLYDWYKIYMVADTEYELKSVLSRNRKAFKRFANDSYGELFSDPDGNNRVAFDDDNNSNYQFKIIYTPSLTQNYYLRVRTYISGESWNGEIRYLYRGSGHIVSKPTTPSGPNSANPGESITYTTGGSTCSQAHTVHYRFNWGDGNISDWASATSLSHTYTDSGTYSIRTQAICTNDSNILSEWSDAKSVNIISHTVSTPSIPDGPSEGDVGQTLAFTTGNSQCNQSHPIEYRFDWGDGGASNWSFSTSCDHSFKKSGIYSLKAQARCSNDTNIVSTWSNSKSVTIPEHTVSTPSKPSGPEYGDTHENLNYTTGDSTCSNGHSVEYRFDWGDGNITDWSDIISLSHSYPNRGHYGIKVQSRCILNNDVISDWATTYVHIATFVMDFDRDGKTDLAIWNKINGEWRWINSSNGTEESKRLGDTGSTYYVIVPGDYDGDRKTDIAVWKKATGDWYYIQSSNNVQVTKKLPDANPKEWIPVPGDYDGDKKTDVAVWNKITGEWRWICSSNGLTDSIIWGDTGVKDWIPVPGDYDGDGTTDVCVWHKVTGNWYGRNSTDPANPFTTQWKSGGISQWIPMPGDYDGDLKTDLAVWKKYSGEWHCKKSSNGDSFIKQWRRGGNTEWIPVSGDYDGDGKFDLAVWHKTRGQWYCLKSIDNVSYLYKVYGDMGLSRWIPVTQLQHIYMAMESD